MPYAPFKETDFVRVGIYDSSGSFLLGIEIHNQVAQLWVFCSILFVLCVLFCLYSHF